MERQALYQLEQVSYTYSNQPALQGIDLTVYRGDKLMLLGPNGCGKSTLQKLLAGLLFAEAGTLTACGQPLTAAAMRSPSFATAFRGKVGFVFQNSDVQLFCATVKEELMFGPLSMGLSTAAAAERADSLLVYAGLSHLAQRAPQHLSGGEKKKVAIAAILATNPEVLIFDEPTNGLDPKSQRWIIDLLASLHAAGKTIILATHYLEFVPELAERVVVIGENHHIVADGSPGEILQNRQLLLASNLIAERSC